MKILIIAILTISTAMAQLSPEQRRIDERAKTLKDLSASHCSSLPLDLRQECQNNFKDELRAAIRKQSKHLVQEAIRQADSKINAQIQEEGLIAEYSAKLAAVNVSHNCTTSKCLIAKYNEYLESIKPIEPEPQASDSQIGGASDSQMGG